MTTDGEKQPTTYEIVNPNDAVAAAKSENAKQEDFPEKPAVVVNNGMPKHLVLAGIVVGLLLIFSGAGLLLVSGTPALLSSLMTCVGFGIVLAAFGSQAGGSWAGWTATGAGAMAIILFLVLEHFTPPSPTNIFKRGQIRGALSKIADLRIVDESPMYEFRDPTTLSIHFIMLDHQLKTH